MSKRRFPLARVEPEREISEVEMQRLHIECEFCRPAIANVDKKDTTFPGSTPKVTALVLPCSTVAEWSLKC
jgi:hypothetical protein